METLLFWALPVIMVLAGFKGGMMGAWRLFFASMTALYVGVWIAPAWWGLLDFLPAEAVPYRNAAAVLAGVAALFAILYKSATAITPASRDETFVFPRPLERILNVVFRFGFGAALSTLVFVLCCSTPLRMLIRNHGDGMQILADSALLRISSAADKITFSKPSEPRGELLKKMNLWYVHQPEEKSEDRKDAPGEQPQITPPSPKPQPAQAPAADNRKTSSGPAVRR